MAESRMLDPLHRSQTGPPSNHRLARVAIAACAIAAMVAAGSMTFADRVEYTTVTTAPYSIPVVLVASIDQSPTTLGVADSNLYLLSDAEIARTLDELQAMGVKDIRIGAPWIYIQPDGPDSYDWEKLDTIVDAAQERDMNIVMVVSGTPSWAGFPINGHVDPDVYATFAGTLATRYQGRVSAYEIWNEPNGFAFYNPVDPEAYTAMLKAAYPAIKAADPEAVVIAGVLGAVPTGLGTLNPVTFVQRMYAAGAKDSFDALSYHPYHYWTAFSEGGDVTDSPINQMTAIYALMVANGDGDLKIWATEYGLPTGQLSEAQQAAYIADLITRWQTMDGAGPIFIYSARDSNTGSWDAEDNFGLFRTDWTAKPAVAVVTAMIADLADGKLDNPFTGPIPQPSVLTVLSVIAVQFVAGVLRVPLGILKTGFEAFTGLVTDIVNSVLGLLGASPASTTAKATAAVADTAAVRSFSIASEQEAPVANDPIVNKPVVNTPETTTAPAPAPTVSKSTARNEPTGSKTNNSTTINKQNQSPESTPNEPDGSDDDPPADETSDATADHDDTNTDTTTEGDATESTTDHDADGEGSSTATE